MAMSHDGPAIPEANEEDTLEQQLPAEPDPAEDSGAAEEVQPHGDPLFPGGSEADRLEQARDGGAPDGEEDYPRDSGPEYPEDAP
ncbi:MULTISPECIES: hypothetical protein [Arthrobacter]|uniref:Uncharacterized protein n=1 Tax=Arthrobacter caoxuetaonis TaxID=2886935 RepID=A0A9X1MDH6_9MICC|nr:MULTISPECIES: hypothetical protein [Arthrobacter]MCC3282871.1 hypothetical protein [Arthrobacter caoxuetaonis]MCC3297999.1 hypothetical protein [Arthrobacter caoxuetaonis]MCC9192201.1 hypothetical protein [Arthrobacter sp. zg-Y916]USQ57013.1 hypothetical protein NF551_14965 [Arthrobacter caoxuetaonis]